MEITASLRKLIDLALEEDLSSGDITAELTIDERQSGRAELIAKEALVVCGGPLIGAIAEQAHMEISCKLHYEEGGAAHPGQAIAELQGGLRHLLMLERTILNFMQRTCGVATYTRAFCKAANGITVLDTRKTMPGWRYLDKYSVRTGGGANHRKNLGEMVLVKNNHIDANGGSVEKTLRCVYAGKAPYIPVEVEVRTLDELRAALPFRPNMIMLDNMSNQNIAQALEICAQQAPETSIEISGGITESRLAELKSLGVKSISVGGLTTRARNVDISMAIR